MSLKNRLEEYSKSNMYPFHMPGHKRMLSGPYKIDMTEVENVDDLHDPSDVIKWEQERIAGLYKAYKSYILVGGSTVGNLAAVYACCNEGELVYIQRNSHKSVYNAVMLRHLCVEYIPSRNRDDGIFEAVELDKIKAIFESGERPKAVVITSPTYEGFHAPVEEIAKICHKYGSLLIVDQAHGAHLGFHPSFTHTAVGVADCVVQSLHKTLPALTQTAVLHVADTVDCSILREALDIFETSSPSYVLMNSVSECMNIIENSSELFDRYVENLQNFYKDCGNLQHLRLLNTDIEKKDPGKLVISTQHTNITGVKLAKILRENYEIETELSSFAYVLAMTSIMDTKEGFNRLSAALHQIDTSLTDEEIRVPCISLNYKKSMEIFEAKAGDEKLLNLEEAKKKTSATMVCIYPPGSPIIVPGEKITDEVVALIRYARDQGLHITGLVKDAISVVN